MTVESNVQSRAKTRAQLSEKELAALESCSKAVATASKRALFSQGGVIETPIGRNNCVFYSGPDKATHGCLGLPATADDIAKIAEVAETSAHGHGDQTVIDKTYRSAKELKSDRFALTFDPLPEILQEIQETYHRDDVMITAKLHKLNIYTVGDFFKGHRDTPRGTDHIGSLVVCLPSKFEGGQLVVKSQERSKTYDWSKVCSEGYIGWAFRYSDCEHEVLAVTTGSRLTLAYDVYARPVGTFSPQSDIAATDFYAHLRAVVAANGPTKTLAFGMQHAYPQRRKMPKHRYGAWQHDDTDADHEDDGYNDIPSSSLKGVDRMIYQAAIELGLNVNLGVVRVRYDSESDDSSRMDLSESDESETEDRTKHKKRMPYWVSEHRDMGVQNSDIDYEYRFLKDRLYVQKRPDLIWVTPTGSTFVGGEYLRHGNEVSLDYLYVAGVILVDIPEGHEMVEAPEVKLGKRARHETDG